MHERMGQDSRKAEIDKLKRLQLYLEQDQDNLSLAIDLTDLAIGCNDSDAARYGVERALAIKPNDPYVKLRYASVLLLDGLNKEALDVIDEIVEEGYDDIPVRYNRAIALSKLNEFDEARKELSALEPQTQASAIYPQLIQLLLRVSHHQGEIVSAIEVAQRYLANHPEDSAVLGMLSLLHFDNDDMDNAEASSEEALKLDRFDADALIVRAWLRLADQDGKAAEDALNEVISLQPENGRAWVGLGLVSLLKLDMQGAEDRLRRAVKYLPTYIGGWHILAWSYLLDGQLLQAEECFNSALSLDDTFGETHGGLAVLAAMRGDWALADNRSIVARRLSPGTLTSKYVDVLKAQRSGDAAEGIRLLHAALNSAKGPRQRDMLELVSRIKR